MSANNCVHYSVRRSIHPKLHHPKLHHPKLHHPKLHRRPTKNILRALLCFCLVQLFVQAASANEFCGDKGIWVQVLGAGGSDLAYARAGASYLVWHDQKARILIDAGAGSALRFAESKARFEDLEAVLFTHLHPEAWVDFPVLLRRSYYGARKLDLPVLAPVGNRWVPDPTEIFNAWRILNVSRIYPVELLASLPVPVQPNAPFRLNLTSVPSTGNKTYSAFRNDKIQIKSVPVAFGNVPAVAWHISADDVSVIFAGSLSNADPLTRLAEGTDLLVMNLGIEEGRRGLLRELYMPPSSIGRAATRVNARSLLLSYRMGRSLGLESQTHKTIEAEYDNPILLADDNDCFGLEPKSENSEEATN